MKALFLHASYFAYRCVKNEKGKSLKLDKTHENSKGVFFNCLVVKVCFSEDDSEKTISYLWDEVICFAKRLRCKDIIVFPFAHLDNKILAFKEANLYYKNLEQIFIGNSQNTNINISFVPFGFDKEFVLHIKGHPLNVAWRDLK